MNRTTHTTAAPRLRSDQGVALVEAAFITPVLLVLVLGMLEYGLLFRDYLTVSDAAANGARVGAIQGPDTSVAGDTADQAIVASIREDLANIRYTSIDRIVVFRAGPPGAGAPLAQVPESCKTGAAPRGDTVARCNIYAAYDAFLAVQAPDPAYFKCGGANAVACGWDPTGRVDGPKIADIEYLGVYLKLDRPMVTGVFGRRTTLEVASIVRLEPGQLT
ncbi:MAG: TadE/TadG family type IV pilus assembly protein [Acidimicrobiales bacterium]